MKPSLAPCIISRRARPGPSSASIVSRRCLPTSPAIGRHRWRASDVHRQAASGRMAARCTSKASSTCPANRSGCSPNDFAHWTEARQSLGNADPDVRVIVSTTRDVDEELAAGRLIPELHRALPKTLDLAPLRARLDDLPVLAPYILRRQAEQAGRTVPIISDAIAEAVEELPLARQSPGAAKRARIRARGQSGTRSGDWRSPAGQRRAGRKLQLDRTARIGRHG